MRGSFGSASRIYLCSLRGRVGMQGVLRGEVGETGSAASAEEGTRAAGAKNPLGQGFRAIAGPIFSEYS